MKVIAILSCLLVVTALAGCDLRSDTAKREMEKFSGTPTPTPIPTPTEAPIDPSDVVQVDVNLDGEKVTVNGYGQKKSIACPKFNRVMISGGQNVITIKGACRQIMINGDGNDITVDAATEFAFNGGSNIVRYSRFVNGKRPIVTDNGSDNSAVKVAQEPVTSSQSNSKTVK